MLKTNRFLFAVLMAMFLASTGVVSAEDKKAKDVEKSAEKKEGFSKVQFAELSHDFGKTPQNSTLKHTFQFKNVGTEVLIIEKVKAG